MLFVIIIQNTQNLDKMQIFSKDEADCTSTDNYHCAFEWLK